MRATQQSPPKSNRAIANPFLLAIAAVAVAFLVARITSKGGNGNVDVCSLIVDKISSASRVSHTGDAQYTKNTHYFTTTAFSTPKCSVEPGTAEDVGEILRILGAHRTPFAIKGGGHLMNQGASSTTGVLVSMSRFSQVTYDADSQTAVVGSGLLWEEVYEALLPHGVTVVGGRISGVGVAGLLLGGGYSYHTNQYGLAFDNIKAYELVEPGGKTITVTEQSHPDLFFGLRGGYNNFGVVTSFTLKTYPQGLVWGGPIVFAPDKVDEYSAAIAKFSAEVSDPKAALTTSYTFMQGSPLSPFACFFYDGPTPPADIFDSFLNITSVVNDAKTRDYVSMVKSAQITELATGHRTIMSTVPIAQYTPSILEMIRNETEFWGAALASKSLYIVLHVPEPFLSSTMLVKGAVSSPSAYLSDRTYGYTPLGILYSWDDAKYDEDFHNAVRESTKRITQAAIEEGQDIQHAAKYPNYAMYDTPLEEMYGKKNLERLRELKKRVDPENVMGLAGGFKF